MDNLTCLTDRCVPLSTALTTQHTDDSTDVVTESNGQDVPRILGLAVHAEKNTVYAAVTAPTKTKTALPPTVFLLEMGCDVLCAPHVIAEFNMEEGDTVVDVRYLMDEDALNVVLSNGDLLFIRMVHGTHTVHE